MKRMFIGLVLMLALVPVGSLLAEGTNSSPAESKEAAHARTLNDRAAKIVATLGVADVAKSNRVHGIVVRQYCDLAVIHEERDVQIKAAKEKAGADKAAASAAVQVVRDATKPKLDKLHGEFLGRLSAELSPEQVDKVKDGMTYGVLPLTYGVYLKMYPDLTVEQKAQIKTWLTEARELAMDGSTADEKHAVFGKYKGKINNYLSKAGYDAKKAEQNLRKSAAPAPGMKSN
jgi:hypothetical protein